MQKLFTDLGDPDPYCVAMNAEPSGSLQLVAVLFDEHGPALSQMFIKAVPYGSYGLTCFEIVDHRRVTMSRRVLFPFLDGAVQRFESSLGELSVPNPVGGLVSQRRCRERPPVPNCCREASLEQKEMNSEHGL